MSPSIPVCVGIFSPWYSCLPYEMNFLVIPPTAKNKKQIPTLHYSLPLNTAENTGYISPCYSLLELMFSVRVFTRSMLRQVICLHELIAIYDISEFANMTYFVAFFLVAATLIASTAAVPYSNPTRHLCDKLCHPVKPVCPEGEAPTGGEGCWGCCQPIMVDA